MNSLMDLRETLQAHADLTPTPDFQAQVHRRIRVLRKRRQAAALSTAIGAVAVLLLAVPGVAPTGSHLGGRTKSAWPTYDHGGRLAGAANFLTSEQREQSFTITPRTWGMYWTTRCTPELPRGFDVVFLINGKLFMGGSCSSGGGGSVERSQAEALSSRYGMELGKPSVITVRVTAAQKQGPPDGTPYDGPMPDLRVEMAIYVPVSLGEYHFPPRPATLKPLQSPYADSLAAFQSTAKQIVGTQSATLTYRERLAIQAFAVEPGSLRFLINGMEASEWSTWDFVGGGWGMNLDEETLSQYGLHLRPGEQVTITVIAERFTDPDSWQVQIVEYPPDAG